MAAASSWDRWAEVFTEAGHAPLTPAWPDDPETVDEAKAHPEVFATRPSASRRPPRRRHRRADQETWVIGHSFGGLLAQIIAGRGEP